MFVKNHLERGRSLKSVSTLGIGGVAKYFITVHTREEMVSVAKFIQDESLPFYVIGKGSNSLFHDKGFDGLIVLNKINSLEIDANRVKVGGGYSFSYLGVKTARTGLGGLEFASGIPGTVGGAIYMNAGANGSETQDFLTSVTFIDFEKGIIAKKKEDLVFGYRTSSFQLINSIIIEAEFKLTHKNHARDKQIDFLEYRMATQPYNEKSAGCIFRNPDDISAGALIEQCGLKGKRIGGAVVSLKHANFILNDGNASATDVLELIQFIQKKVKEKTGIEIKTEIKRVPYTFGDKSV